MTTLDHCNYVYEGYLRYECHLTLYQKGKRILHAPAEGKDETRAYWGEALERLKGVV